MPPHKNNHVCWTFCHNSIHFSSNCSSQRSIRLRTSFSFWQSSTLPERETKKTFSTVKIGPELNLSSMCVLIPIAHVTFFHKPPSLLRKREESHQSCFVGLDSCELWKRVIIPSSSRHDRHRQHEPKNICFVLSHFIFILLCWRYADMPKLTSRKKRKCNSSLFFCQEHKPMMAPPVTEK